MKIKKRLSIVAALLIVLPSLLTIISPQIASALAPYTCTWTGATNNNFNTAGNWTGCNSAAPQPGDADNLIFDVTSLGANTTLTNDITSLVVGTITFTGTNSNFYHYTISGNALTINGGISAANAETLDLDITLGANQSFAGTGTSDVITVGSATAHTLDTNGHTLTLSAGGTGCGHGAVINSSLVGSGALTVGVNAILSTDSPSYTGAITVNSGATLNVSSSQGMGTTGAGTTVNSGGHLSLGFTSDMTVAEPLSLAGSDALESGDPIIGLGCFGGGGAATTHTVTLTGAISLTADVTANGNSYHNITITGPLSGAHTITVAAGSTVVLTINSSANTSSTPNGGQQAPAQTITVAAGDNQPGTAVSVLFNQTYVIDGVRGDTLVDSGGILEGTGTVGGLSVFGTGRVAPGHSPGCLNTGNLYFSSGFYDAELGGTTPCNGYDQLTVTGTVTLDDLSITDHIPATLNTTLYGGFKPAKGNVFTIIDNDGTDPVIGTFANLPEGTTFTVSGYVFKISYVGGTGNDVTLTVLSVPTVADTGFALIKANPLASFVATILFSAGILVIARRTRKLAIHR